MSRLRFLRDERAGTMAEFALTLPLLMTFRSEEHTSELQSH